MYDATHPTETSKFGEISMTEFTQEIIAFLLFAGFLIVGWKVKPLRYFSYLASMFFMMSFIREFNEFIDNWFYFVLPFLGVSIYIIIRYFKKIVDGISIYIRIPSSGLFMVGFLITYVFSRFFGREKFWRTLMEDGYLRMVKATAEEGIELLGYCLLFIALIELLVSIPGLLNQEDRG